MNHYAAAAHANGDAAATSYSYSSSPPAATPLRRLSQSEIFRLCQQQQQQQLVAQQQQQAAQARRRREKKKEKQMREGEEDQQSNGVSSPVASDAADLSDSLSPSSCCSDYYEYGSERRSSTDIYARTYSTRGRLNLNNSTDGGSPYASSSSSTRRPVVVQWGADLTTPEAVCQYAAEQQLKYNVCCETGMLVLQMVEKLHQMRRVNSLLKCQFHSLHHNLERAGCVTSLSCE